MTLTPAQFSILLALSRADLHGYAILQDAAAHGATLRPGTLYRAIKQLVLLGLIVEIDPPPDGSVDIRRRYYRITDRGRDAAAAAAEALGAVLSRARLAGLLDAAVTQTVRQS
jgi:DNA-binding PadR family transcriptional regulator